LLASVHHRSEQTGFDAKQHMQTPLVECIDLTHGGSKKPEPLHVTQNYTAKLLLTSKLSSHNATCACIENSIIQTHKFITESFN